MNKNAILFYGQVGAKKGKVVGGGQIGNQKTVNILKRWFEVFIVQRPYKDDIPLIGAILYLFKLFFAILKIISNLLSNKNIGILHVSGFYFEQIYVEAFLVFIASLFRRKSVYELRAGGALDSYNYGGKIYKKFFEYTVSNADLILTQGQENIPLLNSLKAKNIMYYPNYVSDDFVAKFPYTKRNDKGTLKIVYFGRLKYDKNIVLMINTLNNLIKEGVNCSLELIGIIEGEGFKQKLDSLINEYGIANCIVFKDPLFGDSLWGELLQNHFYLFPTANPREGHSNALTEAMALGLVPICSNHGFNKSVVGKDTLVVEGFDYKEYSSSIKNIWLNSEWENTSKYVYNRVIDNYKESIISDRLISCYKNLII